jgi:hypothetical protein
MIAAAVTVASLSPPLGVPAGGTVVTLTGSSFLGTSRCRFDSTVDQSASVQSASTLLCVAPALAAGAYDVDVTNNDLDYTTMNVVFTVSGACSRLLWRAASRR